jgi:anthranilate synthase component I
MSNYNLKAFLQDAEHYRTIPIVSRFFADVFNPLQIFRNLKEEAVYLLESKDDTSPWSRFSFIGLSPFLTITDEKNGTIVIKNEQDEAIAKLKSLKDAFLYAEHQLKVKTIQLAPPFTGGAVGFISYDFISHLEKISPHPNDDLLMKKIYFSFCESIIAFDHAKREIIFIHYVRLSHEDTEQIKTQKYNNAIERVSELMRKAVRGRNEQELLLLSDEQEKQVCFADIDSTYCKEKFIQDVEKIKHYIRSGDIFQAVLSQRFSIPVQVDAFQLYRMLRQVNPSPYMFYIRTEVADIIGSSPEKLIQVQNRHLEIHPIAGTRRRGRNEQEDEQLAMELLNDPKERAEHFMLVDLARNDIGKVANYGTVQTPQLMEIGKFSHVMHLISKVTGELREDIHPIEALLAAFPAGTVSGAPKIRAMQILNELEPTARNVYAGSIAYIGFDGNIDSCIAIRTIILKERTAYVQAGAGIVADSVPELEWKETQNKASASIKAITLAERLFAERKDVHV